MENLYYAFFNFAHALTLVDFDSTNIKKPYKVNNKGYAVLGAIGFIIIKGK